jgi:hypothetical protein
VAPRITMSLTVGGELEIHLNDEGRSLLIQKLQTLSERNDHFHLAAWYDAEVGLGKTTYRPNDKIVDAAKILLRTDEWDRQHYPHVLDGKT